MTNKNQERFATFQLKQPSGVAIVSGNVYLFGKGTKAIVGVAAESQVASGTAPAYDSASGYFTLDCEGVFNLSVQAFTLSSPTVPGAINPGDAVYADAGTYDSVTGVTTGSVLSLDSTGTFIGNAMDAISAGVTATIRVILKNAPC